MSKNVLIVESPSKAKTIKKFLGPDFEVLSSVGHIKDLPEKELGVDIQHDFKPRYVTIRGKIKIIQRLKNAAREARMVYLAPDPDREGEAIAWHIANIIDLPSERVRRVLFNEITAHGIKTGISQPRMLDLNLVNAQQARRVLDRIVGYQVSPFLWKTLYRGLSAGRVQSVAVRIICDREAEIQAFRTQEYWELFADLASGTPPLFSAKCIRIQGKKPQISNESEALFHLERLKTATLTVETIDQKEIRKSPAPPFTTSTLQQEATRKLKFTPHRTMLAAQQLYEGVEINGQPVGLITYMRTDSVRISGEALTSARALIAEHWGAAYLPANPRHFKNTRKNIQDAHEGIRPTRFDLAPEVVAASLTPDQRKLYSLIWNRFIASQMAPALYRQKLVDIRAGDYLLRSQGNELLFDGYLKVYRQDKKEEEEISKLPPDLQPGLPLTVRQWRPEQKFTEPPSRFTDGTLIRELDTLGIGRPSTYASIVTTVLERKYIERQKGYLLPTELGQTVNRILIEGMDEIFNVQFTEKMEAALDFIESSRRDWIEVIREFYQPFHQALEQMDARRATIKGGIQLKAGQSCELCGAEMLIKWSKNGKFLACSAFPKCRHTRPLDEPESRAEAPDKVCPACQSPMVIKEGRYGKFYACSNYPRCKTTEPFSTHIACPAPGCDGVMVTKRTRKGKLFYGCNRYPACKFATWNQPVNQSCPLCGFGMLEQKQTRDLRTILYCGHCKSEINTPDESTYQAKDE